MLEYATLSISREATLREAREAAARRGPTLNPEQEARARLLARLARGTPAATGLVYATAILATLQREETDARRARLQHLETELATSSRASRDPVREAILDELARRRALAQWRPTLMIRRGGPS